MSDNAKEILLKNAYVNSFNTESEMLKMFILANTKCLIDDKVQRYVYIDNERLRDELRYYKFYGSMENDVNILNIILPVVLSNTVIEKSDIEIIELVKKYMAFLKMKERENEYILASIIYNKVIHSIIDNPEIEYTDIMDIIKEKIIGFNPDIEKTEAVKYQMYRIKMITRIDEYSEGNRSEDGNDALTGLLNALFDIYIEDRTEENSGCESLKNTIFSILGKYDLDNIKNIDFVNSMAEYIIKLRGYKIGKHNYNKKANPLELINLNEGDSISDPIFNKITIISKEMADNILKIDISSKSGEYCFRFAKKS